jgi:hypothetical protein
MPIFVPGVERSMAVSVVPLVTCKILSVFFKQGGEREKERKRERGVWSAGFCPLYLQKMSIRVRLVRCWPATAGKGRAAVGFFLMLLASAVL